MTHLETASDLRLAWKVISAKLALELDGLQRLTTDPHGTLRAMGYEMGPEASAVLATALP